MGGDLMVGSRAGWWMAGCAAVVSGGAWFFGTGLHPVWWLTWVALLPLLWVAPRVRWGQAVVASFSAGLIGSLTMWTYYSVTIPPIPLRLLATVGPAAMVTGCVLMFRTCVGRGRLWLALWIVPAMWVGIEYLSEFKSPHSTFGNLAYSQMDCLPLIQIAAVTGIWGVSFVLLLFPALVGVLLAPNAARGAKLRVAGAGAATLLLVLGFGAYRLATAPGGPRVTVGLLDSDRTLLAKRAAAVELMRSYAAQVPGLVARGAQVVVIPEKMVVMGPENQAAIDALMNDAAKANHADIVVGVDRLPNLNESRFYSSGGRLAATYEKHHLLPAFEGSMAVGTERVMLPGPAGQYGLTICKDMDFPRLSRQYGEDGARVMLVPAWDFNTDGWLHSRMAILRGVESGFSIARAAKEGRLTVSDDRGRVLTEATTSTDGFRSVVASVSAGSGPLRWAAGGDWFAWGDLVGLAGLFWAAYRR